MAANGNLLRAAAPQQDEIRIAAPLIEVTELSKHYGPEVAALDHVDLMVERGEWLAGMGPAGSMSGTRVMISVKMERSWVRAKLAPRQ